ncbi:MAG: hypothetical protein ACJ8CH_12665 [Microvirga sp.]
MTTATVDLTVAGTGGTINGAVFTNQSGNAGTGIFNTFAQLQRNGIEQGYNSDAAPQFDEKTSHQHNHSILLADVPIFVGDGTGGTVEGVVYREFRFDANEVGGAGRLLSLDKLEIWQEESGSLTNFTSAGSAAAGVHYASGPGFAGAHTDYLAYNLDQGGDHWIAIDSGLSSGSGKGDMRVFIPDSYFINDAAHRYVTLFSQFGAQGGNYGASSGYEEWGVNSTSAGSGNTATFLLNKTASVPGGTADVAGEVISYSITLSNVGNVGLTGVTVVDPLLQGPHGTLSGPTGDSNANGVLDVSEVWTYTGTYTVQQSDLDSNGGGDGTIDNTVTADTTQTTALSASANVIVELRPHVTLAKTASVAGGTADSAGEVISYTVDVTNDGNSAQADPIVSDPSVSDLAAVLNLAAPVLTPQLGGDGFYVGDTDHNGILDAGETWSFFNVGDLDQNGTQDLGETFEFRNSGDTNLDVYGHVGDGRVNVGETWHYTATHTVTQAEMDAGGSITNTASVTTAEGATAQGSAPVTVEQRPELVIEKTGAWVDGADGDGFANVDELVNYTITVTNTGNVTLHDVTVTDPSATLVRGADVIGNNDASFDVGEQWSFTGSHAITQDEIDAGNAHNEATAAALGPQGQPASGTDANDAALPQNPHLTLTKMGAFVDGGSEPNGYADPGETVHYTFSIENDGNVTLSSLLLSDSLGLELIGPTGGGDSDFDGLLDVGETWTFEGDYGLTAADIAAGTVHNEATASAQGPQAQAVSDDASADTALPPPPPAALMTLDKSDLQGTIFVDSNENGSADTGTGTSGDLIEYVISLKNVSSVDLSSITLDDPLLGGLLGPPDGDANNDGILSVGESWSWVRNYFITAADATNLNNGGAVHNVATATAHDPSSNVVTATAYGTSSSHKVGARPAARSPPRHEAHRSAKRRPLGRRSAMRGRRCRLSAPGGAASSSRRGRPAACG